METTGDVGDKRQRKWVRAELQHAIGTDSDMTKDRKFLDPKLSASRDLLAGPSANQGSTKPLASR
jgi:hypothetical protein